MVVGRESPWTEASRKPNRQPPLEETGRSALRDRGQRFRLILRPVLALASILVIADLSQDSAKADRWGPWIVGGLVLLVLLGVAWTLWRIR
jgi:hypothetical protein